MQGVSGLNANSAGKLQLDAGYVVVDFGEAGERSLGATRGGGTLNLGASLRDMPVDGAISDYIKGFVRRNKINPTLTVNLLECSVDNWMNIIGGANKADFPASPATKTHDLITLGEIQDSDYLTNVTWIGSIAGKTEKLMIQLENVLGDPNISLSTADKDEMVITATFRGHVLPSAPTVPAVKIYEPVAPA